MTEQIDVRQYEADRSKVLKLKDGSTWTVRVPKDGDRHTWNKLSSEQQERIREWEKEVKELSEKEKERIEKEEPDLSNTEKNKRVRAFIETQEEPQDVTPGYLEAAQLAVLIEEEPTAEQVVEELSPVLRNAIIQWAVDILRGGQGKLLGEQQKT